MMRYLNIDKFFSQLLHVLLRGIFSFFANAASFEPNGFHGLGKLDIVRNF